MTNYCCSGLQCTPSQNFKCLCPSSCAYGCVETLTGYECAQFCRGEGWDCLPGNNANCCAGLTCQFSEAAYVCLKTPFPQTCSGCSANYKYCQYTYQSTTNCKNYQDAEYTKNCYCTGGASNCSAKGVDTSGCLPKTCNGCSSSYKYCYYNYQSTNDLNCSNYQDAVYTKDCSCTEGTRTCAVNTSSCSTSTPTSTPFVRCCPKISSASAINTCTGAGESACLINASVCAPLYSTNPNAQCSTPTSTCQYTCVGTKSLCTGNEGTLVPGQCSNSRYCCRY